MKNIFVIAALILLPYLSNAQLSMFNVNYSIAVPTGESREYIEETSFRGVSFEGRAFIVDNFSVGGYIGWNVFNEVIPDADYSGNGVDLHGTQYRFLNMMPMQVISHFYFGNFEGVTPYAGAGIGATRSLQRTEIGLVAFSNNNWHLGLSPEVGVYIPINYNVGLNVSARYDYAVKSNNSTYSNLTFNIGFTFLDY